MVGQKSKAFVVIGKKEENILRAMRFYRYMTALDVCHSLYRPSVLTSVRALLTKLSGGDFARNMYLYRFKMPDVEKGNPERIYTLGSRGRDLLVKEFGINIDWYFRPGRPVAYSQMMHNLVLTRILVASDRWAVRHPGFRLSNVRTCYDLAGKMGSVSVGEKGKEEKVSVVPDAWLLFERFKGRVSEESLPVWLEVDRGTMYRDRFKKHVVGRIEFVGGGGYRSVFKTKGVRIAYAAAGVKAEEGVARRRAMVNWTKEVLEDPRFANWAPVFRFCSVSYGEIYESGMFEKPVWYRPDQDKSVGLFEG